MRLNATLKNIINLRKLASDPKRLLAFLVIVGLVLFLNTFFDADSLQGKVIEVFDGDTIVLLDKASQEHTVRLFGIDAPETGTRQPFGEESKAFLASMIMGKEVKVMIKGKDKYSRDLGIVEFEGRDINKIMVENGLAWAYSYYTDAYMQEHKKAQEQKLGLWADEKAQEPYKWRKTHKNRRFQ